MVEDLLLWNLNPYLCRCPKICSMQGTIRKSQLSVLNFRCFFMSFLQLLSYLIIFYHLLFLSIAFSPRFFLFRNRVPAAASRVVSCRAASALIMASRSAKWAAMRLVGASGDGRRYLLWNIWGVPPIAGWFMENPVQVGDFGMPVF